MPEETGDHPSAVSGALGRPFTEQVAFFRNKMGNRVPTQAWDDLDRDEHDRAFMVAGAVKADLLSDLAAAVDKAIAEGRGIEDFRRDFRDIVKRHGWTGWAGEGSTGGEAWRVGVIYRTNSYTSYAAGRYAQLVADDYPWWVYLHGGSLEPREAHLSWDGTPLPPDHPFWKTHYPPSDWGCSCYVIGAQSKRGIRRVGGDPDKKLPKGWDARDPKTGAPIGIGKGWDYAPGASVAETVQAMARKVGAWEYQIAKAFMDSLPVSQADALADSYRALPSTVAQTQGYAKAVLEPVEGRPPAPLHTLGRLRSDQARAIEAELGRSVEGFDFSLDASAVRHVRGEHGNPLKEWRSRQRAVTIADYAQLPRIASSADLVRLPQKSDMGEDLFEQRLTIGNDTFVARWVARGKLRRTVALPHGGAEDPVYRSERARPEAYVLIRSRLLAGRPDPRLPGDIGMFDYELNGEAARRALREAMAQLDDMTPVYKSIGDYLLAQRKARFRSGTDPEGKPWAPKRQSTLDRYKRLGYGTLNRPLIGPSKALSRQIQRIVSKDGVVIGSSLAYARTMQEGAAKGSFGSDARGNPLPWGNIPARRWLDLSDEEELEIVAIVDEHLEGLLEQ